MAAASTRLPPDRSKSTAALTKNPQQHRTTGRNQDQAAADSRLCSRRPRARASDRTGVHRLAHRQACRRPYRWRDPHALTGVHPTRDLMNFLAGPPGCSSACCDYWDSHVCQCSADDAHHDSGGCFCQTARMPSCRPHGPINQLPSPRTPPWIMANAPRRRSRSESSLPWWSRLLAATS